MGQKFGGTLRNLGDAIGQSRNVHFSSDDIVESSFFVLPERRKCLFIKTPPSLLDYEPWHAHVVPSKPVYVYNLCSVADADAIGTAGSERDVYQHVAIASHVVTVSMRFLGRTCPWERERLENVPEFWPANIWKRARCFFFVACRDCQ